MRSSKFRIGGPGKLVAATMLLLAAVSVPAQEGRWEQAVASGEEALANRDYELAEQRFQVALEQSEGFAANDVRRPESLVRMARLYRVQGDFAKPERLYHDAMRSAETAYGADDSKYARVVNEVGRYYHSRRKYTRALEYYKNAFRIRVRSLGREHAEVADSINNLAVLYENQGFNDKAEVYYQYALAIREKLLGADHLDTLATVEHFARLLHKLQRGEEAAAMEQRARMVRAARIRETFQAGTARTPEEIYDGKSRARPPKLSSKVEPEYTEEARIARHEGTVVLQADIYTDGRAGNFRLIRSLGLGLDEKAVAAVRQWAFEPARQNNEPVAFRAVLEINFRLL